METSSHLPEATQALAATETVEQATAADQAAVDFLTAAYDHLAAAAGLVWDEEFKHYVKPYSRHHQ